MWRPECEPPARATTHLSRIIGFSRPLNALLFHKGSPQNRHLRARNPVVSTPKTKDSKLSRMSIRIRV